MDQNHLNFLAQLPLLLNSSMESQRVIKNTIEQLKAVLDAEAVTIFLQEPGTEELVFWALEGGSWTELEGRRMPASKGIVGWVIEQQQPALVVDVSQDHRFFKAIDEETSFTTRNLICVPLIARGTHTLGAIQALNKRNSTDTFTDSDLIFLEQCAHHVSLSLHNALLFEQIQDEHAKLEKLNRRKNEMITVLVHELKTPLTIIQASADILTSPRGKITTEMKDTLARGIQRLTRLATEIRNVSLVHNEALNIVQTPFVVTELLQMLEGFFEEPIKKRELHFIVQKPNASLSAIGDCSLITIVLKHLVSNAIRFTPNGGTIKLRAIPSAGSVEFSVNDTGIGIPEDEVPVIFERFYQVAAAANHSSGDYQFRSGGLGLGLATCKSILAAHGAGLNVESIPEGGSTFRFCLPQERSSKS